MVETKKHPQLNAPTPYQLRTELETAIIKDLLGPVGGETEEITESSVSDRYLVGLLAPQKRLVTQEEAAAQQDTTVIADAGSAEEDSTDIITPPINTMFPSSLGLTFCVDSQCHAITIQASWGRYEREESQVIFKENGDPIRVWRRYPMTGKTPIELSVNQSIHWVVNPEQAPEVYVDGTVRRLDNQEWIISLFLVNAQTEPSKNRDRAWLFQPELKVTAVDTSNPAIFVRKPISKPISMLNHLNQQENQLMAMLYRDQIEFAVGHGTSVIAKKANDTATKAISLTTSMIPRYEVAKTQPPSVAEIPELADLVLDMQKLAEINPETLYSLTQAYENWLKEQYQQLEIDPSLATYQETATKSLAECQKTLTRIQAGINTLINNPEAREAFAFMNRAMWQQRIHSIYSEKKRRGEKVEFTEIDIPKNRSWYPFQLAFVLLNIPSLTELNHPERNNLESAIADLLWFPTGGGKTEAYLGVAAYAMGIRRLQGIQGDKHPAGVTVLMRYTLRLLTLQQFQRATTLICACEAIRREDANKWGSEPFRIGLWVGQNSTPNYTSGSEEYVKRSRGQGTFSRGGSPHQLTNCPWCGHDIDKGKNIEVENVDKGRGRTFIKCGDLLGQCQFSQGEGLPILVVDEEIYRRLPTLLIATVDKFAQMPWKGPVQMLFGRISGYCDRHGFRSPDLADSDHHKATRLHPASHTVSHLQLRPPDLIIQDELHLISGPLGSLVGLYETAVDSLCTWELNGKKVYPKIIASTATIKQATTQVHNLFARKLQVFPPQAINIQDNFFSRQRPTNEVTPGRVYLGICAQGRRVKAAIIRVYIAALASAQSLYDKYGDSADPWMTLVGYFNSLRELGGTRRLLDDDIRLRLNKMEKRGLSNRLIREIDELTSRKDSTEIPLILDKLETPFKTESKKEKVKGKKPLDVVLATNMISVGVDVKRLGIMVVCGQPKNTAEYIQATSRVGRSYPGLVLTLYNWARPRDLSHYERFTHYHATFYQNVEALSVTPFAAGALYRGLTALLVSLIRLNETSLNGNKEAGEIQLNHPSVQAAVEAIANRTCHIENIQQSQEIRRILTEKLKTWYEAAQNLMGGSTLAYQKRDGESVGLLTPAIGDKWEEFTCLNSLRNVEPSIGLIFTDQPPDEDGDRLPQPFGQKNVNQDRAT